MQELVERSLLHDDLAVQLGYDPGGVFVLELALDGLDGVVNLLLGGVEDVVWSSQAFLDLFLADIQLVPLLLLVEVDDPHESVVPHHLLEFLPGLLGCDAQVDLAEIVGVQLVQVHPHLLGIVVVEASLDLLYLVVEVVGKPRLVFVDLERHAGIELDLGPSLLEELLREVVPRPAPVPLRVIVPASPPASGMVFLPIVVEHLVVLEHTDQHLALTQ
jgi:hypothetical protein